MTGLKKYYAPLIVGLAAGVLGIVPLVKVLSCCLIVPLASFFSLLLDEKANGITGKTEISKGVIFGLLTGLTAAFFTYSLDLLITFIVKSNDLVAAMATLPEMLENYPVDQAQKQEIMRLFEGISTDISENGFSVFYAVVYFVYYFLLYPMLGMVGGIISTLVRNSGKKNMGNT